MLKKLISMAMVVFLLIATPFAMSVNAGNEKIENGKNVYCSPSPTNTETYNVCISKEGDMSVNLKTDGCVIIVVKDDNGKVYTPYLKEKISGYMHASGKYGVREWGFDEGEANFIYHLESGIYSIALSSEFPHTEPSSVIMRVAIPDEIKVIVNGEKISFDQPPIIVDERTLVPVRAIFEELGATVEWIQDTQTVVIQQNEKIITLQIDSNIMRIGNEDIELDVPAQIINERTLVPVRAVAEALDCLVDWDASTVIISEKQL